MDRLSDLPDSILCHILSFLPTKASVSTSILARRWRFLWAYVPNLRFVYIKSLGTIDRVLLLHKLPTLTSLSIESPLEHCKDSQISTWVFTAIHRKVKYLSLMFHYLRHLPSHLFTCETLVSLILYRCGVIPTLHNVWLPCLKKLDLEVVEFENDESLPCLLSGCPVLEYLQIIGHEYYAAAPAKSHHVSSPTVKWLNLHELVDKEGRNRLEINTPALEYLSVRYDLAGPIECGDLSSVRAADIQCLRESESLLKLVENLRNVECLQLYLPYYPAINDGGLLSLWTPSFNNLTTLELQSDYRFLSKFLENANHLEILEFGLVRKMWYQSEEGLNQVAKGWTEPQQVPKCVLSCLRAIKIFVDEESYLEIVRYLLRNAQVLKRMDIIYPRSFNSDMLQKISLFERGSKTCELAFTDTGSISWSKKISPTQIFCAGQPN